MAFSRPKPKTIVHGTTTVTLKPLSAGDAREVSVSMAEKGFTKPEDVSPSAYAELGTWLISEYVEAVEDGGDKETPESLLKYGDQELFLAVVTGVMEALGFSEDKKKRSSESPKRKPPKSRRLNGTARTAKPKGSTSRGAVA